MPTPRRRSSRTRAGSATPAKSKQSDLNRLASLAEDEETPAPTVLPPHDDVGSTPKTPVASNINPPMGEMHPSKVHQSTVEAVEPVFRFGSVGVGSPELQQTPSKPTADSSFEFRFARPGPQLSANAQKMMDDLRGEAMRVKAKLLAEREEAARMTETELNSIGGRKLAQPKGKVGRFSDVHMAEFKKMDSIADHPSSFRAQPGRITPAKPALKRTQSQAKLDERENIKTQQSSKTPTQSERLENDAPTKRARTATKDESTNEATTSVAERSSVPRKALTSLTAITTPTKSSLARALSVKTPTSQASALKLLSKASAPSTPKSTQIPTLFKSPSKTSLLTTPLAVSKHSGIFDFEGGPRSESRAFIRSPGKVDRLKSMLRYPSASARKPVAARSALPVFSLSSSKPNYNKTLPSLPTTPNGKGGMNTKHVTFTPDTAAKNAIPVQNSPSPIKSAIPRSILRANTRYKTTPTLPQRSPSKVAEVAYPSLADHPCLRDHAETIGYPSLSAFRPLPRPPHQAGQPAHAPPSVPGTFTFRSDHTISFGSSPKGFGSSIGQSSIRQVRPSIFPNMPGTFPASNKENDPPIPAIPHGISNKKRHRANSEEETRQETERSVKKVKTDFTYGSSDVVKKAGAPISSPSKTLSSAVKKKGMTLSRLNMLARPKLRK